MIEWVPHKMGVGPLFNAAQEGGYLTKGKGIVRLFRGTRMTLVALEVALSLAGCCFWKTQAIRYQTIDYPKPQKVVDTPIPETLMVYHFLIGSSVDLYHLVIEQANGKEPTTGQRWEENPSDMISELIQRDVEASGLFAKTVDQWSTARYRYALEGKLIKLGGAISEGKAEAVLEAEATLLDFEAPIGAKRKIMSKTYTIRVPSVDTTPSSIGRAMNLAVRRLSESIQHDIRKSLENTEGSEHDRGGPPVQTGEVKVSCRYQPWATSG